MQKINYLAIIISSPSGAGKTTVTKKLISRFKKSHLSISCTTRQKRPGEKHKKDYFFITKQDFNKYVKKKKFLEHAKVHNNFYGTLKSQVFKNLKKKKIVFFDVDWQGARVLRKTLKGFCYSFFLLPPSIKILKKRLFKRHLNNKDFALQRFKYAKKDIIHHDEYDFVIVNNKLVECVKNISIKLKEILKDRKLSIEGRSLAKKLLATK